MSALTIIDETGASGLRIRFQQDQQNGTPFVARLLTGLSEKNS